MYFDVGYMNVDFVNVWYKLESFIYISSTNFTKFKEVIIF